MDFDPDDWNRRIIEEFRANGGRVGGPFEGAPMILIHHRGARSGIERVSPLVYQPIDTGYAIFASKGGAPTNPDWYHNLLAHPEISAEVGTETVRVRAGSRRRRAGAYLGEAEARLSELRRVRAVDQSRDPCGRPGAGRVGRVRRLLLSGS